MFMYFRITIITNCLCIIFLSVIIKTNSISNRHKGNNTIIVHADRLNSITINDGPIRIGQIWI